MEVKNILSQLKAERDRLDSAINALEGLGGGGKAGSRRISAAGLARIRAAQKKRWAAFRATKKS